MLDGLSEFETYRGVVKDAQELLKQHEQAMKQTAEAADKPEMMGKAARRADAGAEGGPGQPGLPAISGRQGVAESAGADGRDGRAGSMSRIRWRPRRCARPPRRTRSRGRSASSARPPINWKRTRWARPGSRRNRPATSSETWLTRSRTAASASLPDWSRSSRTPRATWQKTRARQAQNLKKTREAQQNPNANERREQLKRLAKEQAEIQKDLAASTAAAGQAERRPGRPGRAESASRRE